MPQDDYVVANARPSVFLADLNAQLAAIVTNNSGSAPGTTFAGMFWADTGSTPWPINVRDDGDAAWFPFMDTDGNMTPLDMTVGGNLEVTSGTVGIGTSPSTPELTIISGGTGISAGVFFRNAASSTVPVLVVTQFSATGAEPALEITQADISEGVINFAANDRGAVATSTGDSAASVRVELNGTVYLIPLFTDA